MNTGIVSTGLHPLNIGSVEAFVLDATLNKLPWNLVGATVSLNTLDPNGTLVNYPATYGTPPGEPAGFGSVWYVAWTVIGPAGTWLRNWVVTDANGVHQVGDPIAYDVQISP